jgi:hypothetical protein
MSEMMVRKQINLRKKQNLLLKKLARQRGVSEAEIVRQMLEREEKMTIPVMRDSKKALDEIITFARSLRKRPELTQGEALKWNRQELYEERENRWFKPREKE